MTNPEIDPLSNPEYPFLHDKIPVADGLDGFTDFIGHYPECAFCPYVAEKDAEGWSKSTSRTYMNQVLPNFLYVPVNIPKGDQEALRGFFDFVQNRTDVPAVNITQPHKSSPVLRELYLGNADSDVNVDTLIRNEAGKLEPYDLNSLFDADHCDGGVQRPGSRPPVPWVWPETPVVSLGRFSAPSGLRGLSS